MTDDTRVELSLELGGKTVTLETGEIARQADGSVLIRTGDTIVLVTATMGQARQGMDFFPLSVDYEERMYAAGKIPGGFIKREGRPTEKAILTSRLMDRPIRPLFPYGMRNEVQIVGIPLSVDTENPPDTLAMVGASAALTISKIPFNGPIGAVRVARVNGEFIANPTFQQLQESDMDLVVAGTREAVTTVEAGMMEVPEEDVIAAIKFGHQAYLPTIDLQEELARRVGREKAEVELVVVDPELLQAVRDRFSEEIFNAIQGSSKTARAEGIDVLAEEITAELAADFPERESELFAAVEKVAKEQLRRLIMEYGRRADGRDMDQIRPLSARVGLLPRAHGSGLFTRGQTQVLSAVTLGPLAEAQELDGLTLEESKRFMHQYNFPPFSVGETKPMRGPGRREIGHGALAERALRDMIPDQEEFPYALRVVSEVLESSGSTSMASVCAATLALMDAGVQLKAPVAGIAMGLMTDGSQYKVLTDIMDMEDFGGDMDFKVAGTRQGITALQMDCKITGISIDVLAAALEPARRARLFILDKIRETISAPREEISPYAPRVIIMEIDPEKIGDVIGPGGKIIKKIQADTGTQVDIEQTGKVFISAPDTEQGEKARRMIQAIVAEPIPGEVYQGKVTRLTNFGAFMEISPGKEGLLRLTEYSPNPPRRIEDVLKLGDELPIKVLEIDSQGRVNLTRRGLLSDEENAEMETKPPASAPHGGVRDRERGGDRGSRGGGRPGGGRSERSERSEGGVEARFRPPKR